MYNKYKITYAQIEAIMRPYKRASTTTYKCIDRLGLLGTTELRNELIEHLSLFYYRSHTKQAIVQHANRFLDYKRS